VDVILEERNKLKGGRHFKGQTSMGKREWVMPACRIVMGGGIVYYELDNVREI